MRADRLSKYCFVLSHEICLPFKSLAIHACAASICIWNFQEGGCWVECIHSLSLQVERNKQRKANLHRESREGSQEELQRSSAIAGLSSSKSTLLAQQ